MELVPAPATGIRGKLSGLLDVVHRLLTTEPARMIGYGAAVAIVGAVSLLNYLGFTQFEKVAFDDAVALAFVTITTVVTVIEAIRRFVASPATVLEEVVSAYEQGHAAGHAHAQPQQEESATFTIGSLQPDDADRRPN